MGHFIWWSLWGIPSLYPIFFFKSQQHSYCFYPWLSKVLANDREHYIGNVFSHWPRPCSDINRKRADVLWGYPWVINDGDWWWLAMMMIMRRWKKEEGREWSSSPPSKYRSKSKMTTPYFQANDKLERQISSLRTQIEENDAMMKKLLDITASIRGKWP